MRDGLSRRAEDHLTYDKVAKEYYFHRFYDFQPDLNTANPDVQAEILRIMGFWLQLGVSGFRMDAVPFVIAEKGAEVGGTPVEHFNMLRTFREFLQWRRGDAIIWRKPTSFPKTTRSTSARTATACT